MAESYDFLSFFCFIRIVIIFLVREESMLKYYQRGMIFMKKVMILMMAIFLWGCSTPQTNQSHASSAPDSAVETLEKTKTYLVNNQLEFEIVKTSLTDEIAPTNKNKTFQYLKPIDEQHIFIDVIVKTKNKTSQEYDLDDIYQGTIQFDKKEYDLQLAIESLYCTQISTTDTLKAQEERYLHLYCEVARTENEQQANLRLNVLQQIDYEYAFSLEEVVEDAQVKSIGDKIECPSALVTLLDFKQSKRIEPSQKGFFYSYHPTENEDQIFVVLSLEIKNQTSLDIDPLEYLYCEYQLNGENIPSQMIIESENHKSISKTGSILAKQTRIIYLAMPILKTQANQFGTLTLFVEGQTFKISEQGFQNIQNNE